MIRSTSAREPGGRDPGDVLSTSRSVTLVLLYTMSTLYHSFSSPGLKRIFRKLDHVSIYLLIAGTYTPYMLVSLRDGNGPLMLGLIWSLAVAGILLDVLVTRRMEVLQILIYLVMGWVCMIDYANLRAALSAAGEIWLVAGGVAYTVGVIFYVLDGLNKLRHAHGMWHLFVLSGSMSHFVSVIGYVRQRQAGIQTSWRCITISSDWS